MSPAIAYRGHHRTGSRGPQAGTKDLLEGTGHTQEPNCKPLLLQGRQDEPGHNRHRRPGSQGLPAGTNICWKAPGRPRGPSVNLYDRKLGKMSPAIEGTLRLPKCKSILLQGRQDESSDRGYPRAGSQDLPAGTKYALEGTEQAQRPKCKLLLLQGRQDEPSHRGYPRAAAHGAPAGAKDLLEKPWGCPGAQVYIFPTARSTR